MFGILEFIIDYRGYFVLLVNSLLFLLAIGFASRYYLRIAMHWMGQLIPLGLLTAVYSIGKQYYAFRSIYIILLFAAFIHALTILVSYTSKTKQDKEKDPYITE